MRNFELAPCLVRLFYGYLSAGISAYVRKSAARAPILNILQIRDAACVRFYGYLFADMAADVRKRGDVRCAKVRHRGARVRHCHLICFARLGCDGYLGF